MQLVYYMNMRIAIFLVSFIVIIVAAWFYFFMNTPSQGNYRVGVQSVYFHDPSRPFDGWNSEHASPGYQAMLQEIQTSGDRQIVAAHMWYPARNNGSGRPATLEDFSASKSRVFSTAFKKNALRFFISGITGPDLQPGGEIFSKPELLDAISDELGNRTITASYGADSADGPFPVIIAAHGLGGTSFGWSLFAEFLASHGYVVVAPSFVSDSAMPRALDSPDSQYATSAGAAGLNRAYKTILGEFKVIPNFYRYLFGYEGEVGFNGPQNTSALQYVAGGGQRVGTMMAELFDQRVGDVQTIIDGLEILNKGKICESEYAQRTQPVHGTEVCGRFTSIFDLNRIGIMGHSLGSMTAQFTAARDDRVAVVVGYNNGPPRYWEPKGIFGSDTTPDGQPIGLSKPVLFMHGSEDAFVQNIFRGIMWNTLSAAAGNPEEIWKLAGERALPTDENPQPVIRNAYNRAVGDKMIISVKDVDHGLLLNDVATVASEENPIVVNGKKYRVTLPPARRKAVGQDALNPAFQGEEYTPLGWGKRNGNTVFLPITIRNHYTKNWFDFYLKGEEKGVALTENIDKKILAIQSSIAVK